LILFQKRKYWIFESQRSSWKPDPEQINDEKSKNLAKGRGFKVRLRDKEKEGNQNCYLDVFQKMGNLSALILDA